MVIDRPNIKLSFLSLKLTNYSMSLLLKSAIIMTKFPSIDSIADADNLFWCIVLRKNVSIIFIVGNHISDSVIDIDIVIIIFNNFMLITNVPERFPAELKNILLKYLNIDLKYFFEYCILYSNTFFYEKVY